MTDTPILHAWMDESMHGAGATLDEGVYLLAATVALKDLKMLDAVRSKGLLGAGLRLDFARPKAEPMLWIPDAVAGALGAALKADDTIPREMLAASVTELPVGLG